MKYAPHGTDESRKSAIEGDWRALRMLEMMPEHISGKEATELIRKPEV